MNSAFDKMGKALLENCVSGWVGFVEAMKKFRDQKDGNVQRILGKIAKSGDALVAECYKGWEDITRTVRLNERARQSRMEQVGKRMLDSDRLLQLQLLGLWKAVADESK